MRKLKVVPWAIFGVIVFPFALVGVLLLCFLVGFGIVRYE